MRICFIVFHFLLSLLPLYTIHFLFPFFSYTKQYNRKRYEYKEGIAAVRRSVFYRPASCPVGCGQLGSVEKRWGFSRLKINSFTLRYGKRLFEHVGQYILPTQILNYFPIVWISQTSTEIHISLDERMNPELSEDVHFESKGFMEAVSVTDFPIRDHKVILKVRRRRWTDTRTGK